MALSDYDGIITSAADEWNLDPRYLKAILMQENGKGDPRAVSTAGAIGLGQLMPDTAVNLGVTDPTDPAQSIYGAAKYLDTALNTEGDPQRALLYYHGGPNWRMKFGRESAAYVPAVAAKYAALAPSAANNAMAKKSTGNDDPLKLLDPAPDAATTASPSNGKSALPSAVPADPLQMLDPAPAPGTADTTQPPPYNPVHDFAARIWNAPDRLAQLSKELEPAPDTIYSGFWPMAWSATGDDTARPAMPGAARDILQGLTKGVQNLLSPPPPMGQGGGLVTYLMDESGKVTPSLSPATNALLAAATPFVAGPLHMGPLEPVDITIPPVDAGALEARAAARNALATPEERTAASSAPSSPTGIAPSPERPPVAGGPQPAGAMITPSADAQFTPAEVAAYRTTAEGQKLMENQKIGEPDRNQYIPGVTANSAELEQTAEMARDLKMLGLKSPQITQEIKEAGQINDTARREYLANAAKNPIDITNERVARETDINAQKATVFSPDNVTGNVSMQPVIDDIDTTLKTPENIENTALQKVLGDVRKRLVDADGNAREIPPDQAWGLRRDIDRMTDANMVRDDPNLHYVGGNLNTLSGILDKGIEGVAPGYDDMLATYKQHSQRIDEMTALQQAERNLGSKTNLRFSDFQRFMKNVVDSRATPDWDLNPYKSFSDDTMQRLWNLRDDLRRSASASDLARAPGSDTVPNILDLIRKHAGEAAMHGAANLIGSALHLPPGVASMGVRMGRQALEPYFSARAQAQDLARARGILNPPPVNPLQGP